MTRLGRSVVVGTTFAVALAVLAPAASAGELEDIITSARDATYNATRITKSVWGDQIEITDQLVEHWSGGELVKTNSSWTVAGNGRLVTMGEVPSGLVFLTAKTTPEIERYEVGRVTDVMHMRRDAQRVEIMEGDLKRAALIVDKRSGAVLLAETFNDQGRVFRTVSLSDFKPYRMYPEPDDTSSVPVQVIMHSDSDVLPDELAGYEIVDVFPGPGGSEQGFYSDGLFGFSLFAISKRTAIEGFSDSVALVTDRGLYEMIPTAQDVRIRWADRDRNFVLVGDIPPDHLEEVLDVLPAPGRASMLSIWWHKIFG
ncbi:MAG: hypothetical protein ABFR53_02945 [Actinomycetota bacterium]